LHKSHFSLHFATIKQTFSASLLGIAMAVDVGALWDFSKPEVSEERFRAALAQASGDDALILHTQIARSLGLRQDFAQAQAILAALAPNISAAGSEAQVRYYLELGRTYASATHPPETQTETAREQARAAYLHATEIAHAAGLDDLAIDALHMLVFVDPAPIDQVKWNQQALAVLAASAQPAAKRWEGSLRNNLGYALHQMGRYAEALTQFELALAVREQTGNAGSIRIAKWMIAWTLRVLNRLDEALAMQLQLEGECDTLGQPDPYVFEELEQLYKLRGDDARAAAYAARRQALTTS
jgi:tetratricopeptide (TPR) repeat protein